MYLKTFLLAAVVALFVIPSSSSTVPVSSDIMPLGKCFEDEVKSEIACKVRDAFTDEKAAIIRREVNSGYNGLFSIYADITVSDKVIERMKLAITKIVIGRLKVIITEEVTCQINKYIKNKGKTCLDDDLKKEIRKTSVQVTFCVVFSVQVNDVIQIVFADIGLSIPLDLTIELNKYIVDKVNECVNCDTCGCTDRKVSGCTDHDFIGLIEKTVDKYLKAKYGKDICPEFRAAVIKTACAEFKLYVQNVTVLLVYEYLHSKGYLRDEVHLVLNTELITIGDLCGKIDDIMQYTIDLMVRYEIDGLVCFGIKVSVELSADELCNVEENFKHEVELIVRDYVSTSINTQIHTSVLARIGEVFDSGVNANRVMKVIEIVKDEVTKCVRDEIMADFLCKVIKSVQADVDAALKDGTTLTVQDLNAFVVKACVGGDINDLILDAFKECNVDDAINAAIKDILDDKCYGKGKCACKNKCVHPSEEDCGCGH